jgi:5'(3')-deoxyribonucleotidase
LRSLSLARLKRYVDAYNIKADGVLEKDDLIEKIIAIRVCASSNNIASVLQTPSCRRMDVYHTPTRYGGCASSASLHLLSFGL